VLILQAFSALKGQPDLAQGEALRWRWKGCLALKGRPAFCERPYRACMSRIPTQGFALR
jgi:hypothetical protein